MIFAPVGCLRDTVRVSNLHSVPVRRLLWHDLLGDGERHLLDFTDSVGQGHSAQPGGHCAETVRMHRFVSDNAASLASRTKDHCSWVSEAFAGDTLRSAHKN